MQIDDRRNTGNMKRTVLLGLPVALLLMTACIDDNYTDSNVSQGAAAPYIVAGGDTLYRVTPSVGLADGNVTTRSYSNLTNGSTVGMLVYNKATGALVDYINYQVSDNNGTLTPTYDNLKQTTLTVNDALYLPCTTYDFYFMSPASVSNNINTPKSVTVKQGTDAAWNTSVKEQTIVASGNNNIAAQLNRQCAKLDLVVTGDNVSITKVEVKSFSITGVASSSTSASATLPNSLGNVSSGTYSGTGFSGGGANAYSTATSLLLLPQASFSGTLNLTLCFNSNSKQYPISLTLPSTSITSLASGHKYTLTVSVTLNGGVVPSAQINGWVSGGSGNIDATN
jgi:hypothetical protein